MKQPDLVRRTHLNIPLMGLINLSSILGLILGITACNSNQITVEQVKDSQKPSNRKEQPLVTANNPSIFQAKEVFVSNASAADQEALIATINTLWDRYLHLDVSGYKKLLATDVTRMSQRSGELQQGDTAVAASLPKEWEAFERPNGVIAEKMRIKRAEISVDQNPAATAATVLYWVEINGGNQWDYTDQGLVLQAFTKIDGVWKLTHQIDSWSLDYDITEQKPGQETFEFDYAYPVKNLKQAVNFYKPILGTPENVTPNFAYFNLEGPRFILDATDLDGYAKIDPGLPSGYAIFYVEDVVAERNRLKKLGTKFVEETATALKSRNGDQYVIGLDPSQNIFVLMQRNFRTSLNPTVSAPTGFDGTDPYIKAAKKVATAWMTLDQDKLRQYYDQDSRWFDDTRTKVRGMETGSGIISALKSVYWSKYDRTNHRENDQLNSQGLIAKMAVSSVRVRPVGSRTVVSYQMRLTGMGNHPFQDTAFVTHIFNNPTRIANTFIVSNNATNAMALELDYTGYPVTNLQQSEKFYTNIM